ncbi:hypothetical protein [Haemophilus haemolyticus]|uniref:hypothetical protein n=1 Tax=Haemophilus haemolyticus TaxID=726 RepID=UPI000E591AEC|nr:hypothetical protein [Haemophilus haemolyticus]
MNKISINIEGDYLDSFIYSGVLFLIDFESNLSIVNWENLLKSRIEKETSSIKNIYEKIFLKRKYADEKIFEENNLNIVKSDLKDYLIGNIELNMLPTDINIFSNVIYLSSSNGFSYMCFNGEKRFNKESYGCVKNIFNDCKIFSFDLDNDRGILCAGSEGAIYSIINSREIIEKNRIDILRYNKESSWIDCQWKNTDINSILNIKSNSCHLIQNYKSSILKETIINRIKESNDKRRIKRIGKVRDRIDRCLKLQFERGLDENIKDISFIKSRYVPNIATFTENENCIQIETSEGVSITQKVIDELINWRVFPRAKTHSNQLHIINNDQIQIVGLDIPLPPR